MPVPTYLKVNCGYAFWKAGPIRFGTRPELLTSLVPTTVSELDVSALASMKDGKVCVLVWHHHDDEDEMFLVVKGRLRMRFGDRDVTVLPGEFIIVPRGVEHMPVAEEEVHVVLIEPKTTLNTGNVRNERTRVELQRL